MPTSMTTVPGLTMSAVTNSARPMAAMSTSAWRVSAGRLAVAGGEVGAGPLAPGLFWGAGKAAGLAAVSERAGAAAGVALQVRAAAREQLHDAGGRAGDEAGVVLLRDLAEVDRVEAVDVLFR